MTFSLLPQCDPAEHFFIIGVLSYNKKRHSMECLICSCNSFLYYSKGINKTNNEHHALRAALMLKSNDFLISIRENKIAQTNSIAIVGIFSMDIKFFLFYLQIKQAI